jgi:hypothetical protein
MTNGCLDPYILNLGIRRRPVVSFKPRMLNHLPWRNSPGTTEEEAGRAPQALWIWCRRNLCPGEIAKHVAY